MKRHAQRGSSMVEFAIAALAMLMFVFGIMEFARLLYTYHTVATAARLGSRWAMVRGTACPAPSCPASSSTVSTYVKTAVPLLDTTQVTVSTAWANTAVCSAASKEAPGCLVTVTVTYPFRFLVPIVSSSTISLTSASQMVISE